MRTDSAKVPAQRDFVITRTFDAPRDLVWQAWTERDRLMQWFGPKGFTMPFATLDLRPGGIFHYCLRTPDGQPMWGKFVYREIVPPERIVLVNSFSNEKVGLTRHPMSPTWPLEMLSTTTFSEEGGRTAVTVQWAPLNPTVAERQTFDSSHDAMRLGWGGTFDQLAAYLAKTAGPADRIERETVLAAPLARVWRALSDAEEFGQWFGVALAGKSFVAGQHTRGQITYPGYEYVVFDVLVERLEPQRLLSWRWHPYAIERGVDYSKEPTTLVVFELKEVQGGTMLRMVESGFGSLPPARRAEAFRSNSGGWDEQMKNISRHVAKP